MSESITKSVFVWPGFENEGITFAQDVICIQLTDWDIVDGIPPMWTNDCAGRCHKRAESLCSIFS